MIRLLCTDMDRTLLPNGEAPASPDAPGVLRQLIERASLTLAYVTGRDLGRALDGVAEFGVPMPDFIIGDVGSSIHRRKGDEWTALQDWQTQIARAWGGRTSSDVHALIGADPRLSAQDADRQTPCKQSYYLARDADVAALRDELEERLSAGRLRQHTGVQ